MRKHIAPWLKEPVQGVDSRQLLSKVTLLAVGLEGSRDILVRVTSAAVGLIMIFDGGGIILLRRSFRAVVTAYLSSSVAGGREAQ